MIAKLEWTPGPWEVSHADYHADALFASHSQLEVFRRSPMRYYRRFITRDLVGVESDALLLGSVLHCLVHEPQNYAERFATRPECDGRTKAGKAIVREFLDSLDGQTPIDGQIYDQAQGMAQAIRDHDLANDLITHKGLLEQAYRWTCPVTGVDCRMRADKVIPSAGIICDTKTCIDPSPEAFAKACANFGYARQAAMYRDGICNCGFGWMQFLWIAVGKEPPHEVGIYELDHDDNGLAREQYQDDLRNLATCRETGNWRSEWSEQVNTIKLPAWARK